MTDTEPTYLEKLKAVCDYFGLDYEEYKDVTDERTKRITLSMYKDMMRRKAEAHNADHTA